MTTIISRHGWLYHSWGVLQLITDIMSKVPNIDKVVVSVHRHNDLGLAVVNSLRHCAGAGQIECTVNGIGESAAMALEEIV